MVRAIRRKHLLRPRLRDEGSYYGTPAWARKKEIWPPLSEASSGGFDIVGGDPIRPHVYPASSSKHEGSTQDHGRPPLPEDVSNRLQHLASNPDVLYHPLTDGETIRILELHPGEIDEPITCNFHYANLTHLHMDYEALSYVWGCQKSGHYDKQTGKWVPDVFTIRCNGHVNEVTPNLYCALQHIRDRTGTVLLWADAVCINQDDDRERGHQVTLMDKVYGNATRVHIWLGEKDEHPREIWDEGTHSFREVPDDFENVRAQRAFGAVCDIVNRWQGSGGDVPHASYMVHSREENVESDTFEEVPLAAKHSLGTGLMRKLLVNRYPTRRNTPNGGRLNYGAPDDEGPREPDVGIDSTPELAGDSQFWCSVKDLFDQSWFWRVWVVQEAVLAQSALVRWGNAEIDWRWLGLAAAILRTSYHGVCEKMQIAGVYNAYLMFRMSRMSDLPPPKLSFIQLLRLTRQLEVTDPRDRVYGLLGMMTDGNDPENKSLFLPVDYTISEEELCRRLAWKVIQITGDLSILSSVQYSSGGWVSEDALGKPSYLRWDVLSIKGKDGTPLSSWVPNWETVYRLTLLPWDSQDAFSASKGLAFARPRNTDLVPHVLNVKGIQVGTVGYTGLFMWHSVDTTLLHSRYLGAFFASEPGFRLLSHTFAAGRDAYGSLLNPEDDQPLADLAAYILNLHDNNLKWNERRSRVWSRDGSFRRGRSGGSSHSRRGSTDESRRRSESMRQSTSRRITPEGSQNRWRNRRNRRWRSNSSSISRRSSRSVSRSRSKSPQRGLSKIFSRLKGVTRNFQARPGVSSKEGSRSRSQSTSRSGSRSVSARGARKISQRRGRDAARNPSASAEEQSDKDENFHIFTLHERGYVPLPRKDFSPLFKRHPGFQEQLKTWAERGDHSRFLETALPVCERRRLFITLNGFLGIGPDTAGEGDVVAVLPGGDVPYLLRPIEKNDQLPAAVEHPSEPSQRYLIVGECFVQGLMSGEAVNAANREAALSGPVPHEPTHQKILAYGNKLEKVSNFGITREIERIKTKNARLEQGQVLKPEVLAERASLPLKKEEFHIW